MCNAKMSEVSNAVELVESKDETKTASASDVAVEIHGAVSRSAYHKIGDFRKTSRKIAFWTHQHPPEAMTGNKKCYRLSLKVIKDTYCP